MARPGYQDPTEQAAPAHGPGGPKQQQLEEEQRLEDLLEDDDVKEVLKRLHASQEAKSRGEA